MTTPADLAGEAARALGLAEPLVFPPALLRLLSEGIELVSLDPARLPPGPLSEPRPEFGVLGEDMAQFHADYEFAEWMPGAWPLAFDGAGGFYCLDVRSVVERTAANNGMSPVVWSHSGTLGWGSDESSLMAPNLDEFFLNAAIHPA